MLWPWSSTDCLLKTVLACALDFLWHVLMHFAAKNTHIQCSTWNMYCSALKLTVVEHKEGIVIIIVWAFTYIGWKGMHCPVKWNSLMAEWKYTVLFHDDGDDDDDTVWSKRYWDVHCNYVLKLYFKLCKTPDIYRLGIVIF